MEDQKVVEVKVVFERKPLTINQEEALAFLNDIEGRYTKQALFQLIDNYIKDLADHYFINEKLSIKDVLLKFQKLKDAVDKAKTPEQKSKNKKQ